jgi:hypothetical protein
MNNLIEVIFEEVPVKTLGKFLLDLTKAGQHIKNYSWNAEGTLAGEIDWQSELAITNALSQNEDWAVFINLEILKVGSLRLPQVGIRILHYEDKYDVSLQFEWSALNPHPHLVEALRHVSQTLAKKYEIRNYFAGPEPAEELDTRWFTKPFRTPLTLTSWNLSEPFSRGKVVQIPARVMPMNQVTPVVK